MNAKDAPRVGTAAASKTSCAARVTPAITNPGMFQLSHQHFSCEELLCA